MKFEDLKVGMNIILKRKSARLTRYQVIKITAIGEQNFLAKLPGGQEFVFSLTECECYEYAGELSNEE